MRKMISAGIILAVLLSAFMMRAAGILPGERSRQAGVSQEENGKGQKDDGEDGERKTRTGSENGSGQGDAYVVSREKIPGCGDPDHGTVYITYSDGIVKAEEY